MPLQTSGTISLSQIQTEYGGANNLSISEYYNGGPNSTPNVSTSRISKIRIKGVSGTTDGNADIREFEFDGLGDWGTGDRRTGNNEITISTNMITISDPNSNTEPPLNAWINGSKQLDTPDSRFLVGQVTINSNYYIEFEFVGSATKPLVNDFNKLKIYWDKSDISLDADMGTWEIMVYNQDGMELSYGNITLSESNIVSTVSGSSNSEVWQYFTSTYISDGEALRSTEYFSPQDIDQNPTKLAEKTSNSISSGYLGFIWANPAPNHGVPAGAVSFDFVRTNEANTITQTYNRQGSMNNYDGNKRHMFVHIANATAAGVYQTKSYATFKNADGSNYTSSGGGGSNEPVITPSVPVNTIDNGNTIIFQNTGGNLTSYDLTFSENTICDILLIGGGGGGGTPNGASYKSGGGGAGGMVYVVSQYLLANITYKIKVGNGGIYHNKGFDSLITDSADNIITIDNIIMRGLGGGAGAPQNITDDAKNGGSGGGGGHYISGGQGLQGNTVWDDTTGSYVKGGNDGWNYPSGSSGFHADFGGGAGVNGAGRVLDITGTSIVYATGGDYLGDTTATNGTQHLGDGGDGRFCNGGNCGTAKGGDGGSGIIIIRYNKTTQINYNLEFNLGTPSAIASGGYVSGVSYIPTHSQPYTAISFSDFYYQVPVSSGPPNPPNQTPNKGTSGGLGNTGYEIITGLYANNTSRTEGTTSFDNRGVAGRGSSNNVAYMNLIIQAKPGDVLNLIGRINTSGTYNEYCEFWVWLGSSWSRFTSPNASFGGNRDFNVNYTIPSNTVAGNYALAVACSRGIGRTRRRSWKSYSLEVWT